MKKAKLQKKAAEQSSKKIDNGVYQLIDVSKIKPSKENYRKTINLKGLEELTDSVKNKGVLQPIIVRSVKGNGSFEIVTGHRRHSAAKDAGLKQMPCILKDYTDEDVLEIQVIENSQREDVNPMEEAVGFRKLLDMGKHTPETLAKKLGKSLSYVFGRLSLAKLPEEVQKAVLSEKISLGHALVLTRLRHPSEQKEMMKDIVQRDMSVREAANSMDDYQSDIENAVFDTVGCEKCAFLSRNQHVLFPELKKTGECMDKACFFTKIRDHYKVSIEEKKKQGFKIITDKKEAARLCSYSSKTSTRIHPPGEGYSTPKKYKSECIKCTEHHAFFMYEQDDYPGKSIEFGEICLDGNCLKKMNRPQRSADEDGTGESSESEGSRRISPYTIAAHARACRDRFLRANLPVKVENSVSLKARIMIYNVLKNHYSDEIEAVLKKFNPKVSGHEYGANFYDLAIGIPEGNLEAAGLAILVASIQKTDPEVLLRMTEAAGIDMTKDFGPDEEFLKSKTKDELVKFVGTHKLAVEVPKSGKKGDIVKAILTQDLKGKLTKEMKEVVEMEEGNAG